MTPSTRRDSLFDLRIGLELRNSIVGNVGMVTWPPEPAWSCPGHNCAGDGGCSFGVGDDMDFFGTVYSTLPKLPAESEHIGMRNYNRYLGYKIQNGSALRCA